MRTIILLLSLITIIFSSNFVYAQDKINEFNEVISSRTENTKFFSNGNKKAILSSIVPIHYKNNYSDKKEDWKEINLSWNGYVLDKAPYILEKLGNEYKITDKKSGDWLTISVDKIGTIDSTINDLELELFNTGFKLNRTINSVLDVKRNASFNITTNGDSSINVFASAIDNNGDIVDIDYSIKDGKLIETISDEALIGKQFPIIINPIVDIDVSSTLEDMHEYDSVVYDNSDYVYCYSSASVLSMAGLGYELGATPSIGSTIDTVIWTVYAPDASRLEMDVNVHFELIQTPSALQEINNNISNRSLTTSYVHWDETFGGVGIKTSPELKVPFQELINTYSVSSVMLIADDTDAGTSCRISSSERSGGSEVSSLYIAWTEPVSGGAIQPPENFTLTDLGAITINASWDTADNATDYLLLVSRFNYPVIDGTIYETAYFDSNTSVNLSGYNIDNNRYFFNLFSYNGENLSANYTSGCIGQVSINTMLEGDGMQFTHFLAIIPLIIFLVLSLIFYGKGLVHLLTISYSICLAVIAVIGQWGILFAPICGAGAVIGLILFIFSMSKGDWL